MITWQDPVALALALFLVGLSLWWRRRMINRGKAGACAKCEIKKPSGGVPARRSPPAVIDVSRMRLGRR